MNSLFLKITSWMIIYNLSVTISNLLNIGIRNSRKQNLSELLGDLIESSPEMGVFEDDHLEPDSSCCGACSPPSFLLRSWARELVICHFSFSLLRFFGFRLLVCLFVCLFCRVYSAFLLPLP